MTFGIKVAQHGLWREAMHRFERAVEIDPMYAPAWNNLAIACGLVCQLPLVTMTLAAIGLVTPEDLLKQWRYAIVGAFVVTAAITPGDLVTAQLILGGPMVVLYFVSVALAFLVVRRRRDDAKDSAKEVEEGAQET